MNRFSAANSHLGFYNKVLSLVYLRSSYCLVQYIFDAQLFCRVRPKCVHITLHQKIETEREKI